MKMAKEGEKKRYRKRRFQEGEVHHIYQRTIKKFNIFYDIEDYLVYYTIFAIAARQYRIIVLGLCQMYDHIHMLIEIPPKYSVSSVMEFLKGKSSIMIYSKWANMRFQYRNSSVGIYHTLYTNTILYFNSMGYQNYLCIDLI